MRICRNSGHSWLAIAGLAGSSAALRGRLKDWPGVFVVDADQVILSSDLADFESRSSAMDGVLRALAAQGEITGWRAENYPVMSNWG